MSLSLFLPPVQQGEPVGVRLSLVAPLRPPQHPPLPAALLPHHAGHHRQHHGQVQRHPARGESAGQVQLGAEFPPFNPALESTLISPFDPEPSDHPVLPDPPAVGHVGAPALHRLLLGLLRVPLDQVVTSCREQQRFFSPLPNRHAAQTESSFHFHFTSICSFSIVFSAATGIYLSIYLSFYLSS